MPAPGNEEAQVTILYRVDEPMAAYAVPRTDRVPGLE